MTYRRSDDGFTKVPNPLLEALTRVKLCGYEYRVMLLVIRKTCGWHKEMDWIALSQVFENTGIQKSNASRTIKRLCERNILRKMGNRIGIQQDYSRWKDKLSNQTKKVIKLDKGVINLDNHKRNYIQKKLNKINKGSGGFERATTHPLLAEEEWDYEEVPF